METLFVLTHAIMLICLFSIIYFSFPGMTHSNQIDKRSVIPSLLTKLKSIRINTGHIARTATALLTIFLR